MPITGLSPLGFAKTPYPGFEDAGGVALDEANWDNARVLKNVEGGDELTTARLPPGNWILFAKHIDTSGNYSLEAATALVTVENNNDIIFEEEQAPRWPGQTSGYVRHFVSGKLIPESTKLASEMTKEELFEQYIPYPVAESSYIVPETDFGFDATQLRVWADIQSEIGRGYSDAADPLLYLDYYLDGGGYDGYEPWDIGSITARGVKFKSLASHADGVSNLTEFKAVIDAIERTERYPDHVIAVGGTVITYANRFINNPNIKMTPEGDALIPYYTNKTTQSVRVFLKNAAGSDVGGVSDVDIEGA